MKKLRAAVIGTGYLGQFHAEKYHLMPTVELVGIADTNITQGTLVSKKLNIPLETNYKSLLDKVDIVSIATPTSAHFKIAKDCLSHGVHVLLEKPITQTIEEAETLVSLAQKHQCILQIGHIEQFNAATIAAKQQITAPYLIKAQRLAPFGTRGLDVSIVLDLMIHDINLIQFYVGTPVIAVEAQGASILSEHIDIALAKLTFQNGCIAHCTASRLHDNGKRVTQIIQSQGMLTIDYQTKMLSSLSSEHESSASQKQSLQGNDALYDQLLDFTHCVLEKRKPIVSGLEGMQALDVALQIESSIKNSLKTISHV